MRDAERWWAIGAGVAGLVAFAVGWLVMALPRIDASDEMAVGTLITRRTAVLAGAVLALCGSALLLWPLTAVTVAAGSDAWASLRLFSIAVWLLAFALLGIAASLVAALAWRDPRRLSASTVRLTLDASHLATWSLSAPLAIVSVVATTAVGVQGGFFGAVVVMAATVKVASAVVEIAGIHRRTGWNAGGWAAGVSGYATVLWFAVVLAYLPTH